MSGNFFDILESFVNSCTNNGAEKMKEELNGYDVTTDEGYGEYMKFLGDLRIKASKHNDFFKLIFGEDIGDVIDKLAQDVTNQYEAAKAERLAKEKAERQQKKEKESNINYVDHENAGTKFDISKDHNKHCMPSDDVSDEKYQSICNIVSRYVDENFDDDIDTSWLEAELVEFACWLGK